MASPAAKISAPNRGECPVHERPDVHGRHRFADPHRDRRLTRHVPQLGLRGAAARGATGRPIGDLEGHEPAIARRERVVGPGVVDQLVGRGDVPPHLLLEPEDHPADGLAERLRPWLPPRRTLVRGLGAVLVAVGVTGIGPRLVDVAAAHGPIIHAAGSRRLGAACGCRP